MFLFYFHGEQYILPVLMLCASIFIGIPVAIGLIYHHLRNKKRQLSKSNQGETKRDEF